MHDESFQSLSSSMKILRPGDCSPEFKRVYSVRLLVYQRTAMNGDLAAMHRQ